MIIQIHDKLVYRDPKNEIESFLIMMKNEMEKTFSLEVPLVLDIGIGDNWLQRH